MTYFDGETYEHNRDSVRLSAQLDRTIEVMSDGEWHTLPELVEKAGPGTVASMSARLRDMRKERFGGHKIERRYIANGLYEYRWAQ